jgi:hypothetical protein
MISENSKKERKMTKRLTILITVFWLLLMLVTGCKQDVQDAIFEIQGDWTFLVQATDENFNINLTFNQGKVYLNNVDVGDYVVNQSAVTFEIIRDITVGTVREEYFGNFNDNNNMEGTMTRWFESGTFKRYSWRASK